MNLTVESGGSRHGDRPGRQKGNTKTQTTDKGDAWQNMGCET